MSWSPASPRRSSRPASDSHRVDPTVVRAMASLSGGEAGPPCVSRRTDGGEPQARPFAIAASWSSDHCSSTTGGPSAGSAGAARPGAARARRPHRARYPVGDTVDQPHRERFGGRHPATRQDQVHRRPWPIRRGSRTVPPSTRGTPTAGSRRRAPHRSRRPEIAPQGELETSRHGETLDRRDHRLGQVHPRRPHRAVRGRRRRARCCRARRRSPTGPRRRRTSRPNRSAPRRTVIVAVEVGEGPGEQRRGRGIHRVADLGSIDRHDAHRTFAANAHGVGHDVSSVGQSTLRCHDASTERPRPGDEGSALHDVPTSAECSAAGHRMEARTSGGVLAVLSAPGVGVPCRAGGSERTIRSRPALCFARNIASSA